MRRLLLALIVTAAVAVASVGCGGTSSPTATPIPSTATAAPSNIVWLLVIGPYTGEHWYGIFSTYQAAQGYVDYWKLNKVPHFINPWTLDSPLLKVQAGG